MLEPRPGRKLLYRLAGLSLVLATLLGVVAFPLYILGTLSEPSDEVLPESVSQSVKTLTYIASARFSYLYLTAIVRIGIPLLFVLPVLAIFLVLRETARKSVLLATVSAGLSIIVSIALSQVGYSLVGLSDLYTTAASEVEKAAIVASAGGLIRTLGIGEGISGMLFFSWVIITCLVFQSRNLFRRWVALLGVFAALGSPLYGSVTILATIVGMSWSAFFYSHLIFSPLFLIFLAWSSVMGYNLYRMGANEAINSGSSRTNVPSAGRVGTLEVQYCRGMMPELTHT